MGVANRKQNAQTKQILEGQLREAEDAALRVAQIKADEAEAERLDVLRADIAQIEADERAELEAFLTQIEANLADLAPKTQEWRARFKALIEEADALAGELGDLQEPIFAMGGEMLKHLGYNAGRFERAWRDAGGNDLRLACLPSTPPGSIARPLADAIKKRAHRLAVYNPRVGAKMFMRR